MIPMLTFRVDHTGFGLVLGEDKKRFRSRDGGTVLLRDLLDGGVARAREGLRKRNEDRKAKGEEVVRGGWGVVCKRL